VKVKRTATPNQLAQLANARAARQAKAKARKSGTVARSQKSADELVSRIEEQDSHAKRNPVKKRKHEETRPGKKRSSGLGLKNSLLVGGVAVSALCLAGYHVKQNGGLKFPFTSQNLPPPPVSQPIPLYQQPIFNRP
jgi:cobalamin biosynthesis Mg chelatase CobN